MRVKIEYTPQEECKELPVNHSDHERTYFESSTVASALPLLPHPQTRAVRFLLCLFLLDSTCRPFAVAEGSDTVLLKGDVLVT
jgi:hypothetical protein